MIILTPIIVDLMNPDPLPIINVKQCDTGRGIRATVTMDGQICQFSDEEINIFIRKPDGKLVYNTCANQGAEIVAMFTSQALAAAGKLQAELEIISGEERISTPIALINVLPTNINSKAIESTNEFKRYETIIADANAAALAANNAVKDLAARVVAGEFNGRDGKDGQQGPQGPKGDTGDTGATGARGPQGETGDRGEKGEKGDKGDKGDPGENGITAPVSGFFTLSVDAEGNLWAYSVPDGPSVDFEYDTVTGNLYVVQEAV